MLSSWIRAQLNPGIPNTSRNQEREHHVNLKVPESPALPRGMDESGRGVSKVATDENDEEDLTLQDLFPTNPNMLLPHLRPIMPAADNTVAVASVITLNALFGISLMCRRVPRFGELPVMSRVYLLSRKAIGLLMFTASAIESMRCGISYDPWYEEAREWREWAIRNGDNPGWWFGAIQWYEPMSKDYWMALLNKRVLNMRLARRVALRPTPAVYMSDRGDGIGVRYELPNWNDFVGIYEEMRSRNEEIQARQLGKDFKNVTELNKAEREDKRLEREIAEEKALAEEGYEYELPRRTEVINFPASLTKKHWLASDDYFAKVWTQCDPWWELSQEIIRELRTIPRSYMRDSDH